MEVGRCRLVLTDPGEVVGDIAEGILDTLDLVGRERGYRPRLPLAVVPQAIDRGSERPRPQSCSVGIKAEDAARRCHDRTTDLVDHRSDHLVGKGPCACCRRQIRGTQSDIDRLELSGRVVDVHRDAN